MTVLQVTAFIGGLSTLLVVLDRLEPRDEPDAPIAAAAPLKRRCTATRIPSRSDRRTHGPGVKSRCPFRDRLAEARHRQNLPRRPDGTHSLV